MKSPTLLKRETVSIDQIDVGERLRPVSEAGVESLIASITELGVMKDPIHLRQKKNGQLVLIAGGHRLEAAKRLGWSDVSAHVWADVTDDWARLMEVDDNLAGAEMNALDTAVFLAKRKEVYERLHPETKAATGSALVARRWNTADTMSVVSFATATAEKFGLTDRHVRRMIAVGTALNRADLTKLRAAPKPVTLADLQVIAKATSSDEQAHIVAALSAGSAKSAGQARAAFIAREKGIEPSVKDPVEEAFKALGALWARAPKAAKRWFAEDHAPELLALLDGEDDSE